MTATQTATALRNASEGLTYQSETDAPWVAVGWPSASGEVTADEVRKKGRHRAGVKVEERGIDEFFGGLTVDKDWYGDEEKAIAAKYRSLLAIIKSELTGVKVVRVGERKVAVYVVGQAKEGGWAGLKTTAVET